MQAVILSRIQGIAVRNEIIIISLFPKAVALGDRIVVFLCLLRSFLPGYTFGLQVGGLHIQIDRAHTITICQIVLILSEGNHDKKLSHRENAHIDILGSFLIKFLIVVFGAGSVSVAVLIGEIPGIDLIAGNRYMQGIAVLCDLPTAALAGIVAVLCAVIGRNSDHVLHKIAVFPDIPSQGTGDTGGIAPCRPQQRTVAPILFQTRHQSLIAVPVGAPQLYVKGDISTGHLNAAKSFVFISGI